MREYFVRKGISKRRTNAATWNDLFSIPYIVTKDDGKKIDLGTDSWPEHVKCPDCEEGELVWAEAGNSPGHRICPLCGSHWTICSKAGEWFIRRARFYTN